MKSIKSWEFKKKRKFGTYFKFFKRHPEDEYYKLLFKLFNTTQKIFLLKKVSKFNENLWNGMFWFINTSLVTAKQNITLYVSTNNRVTTSCFIVKVKIFSFKNL